MNQINIELFTKHIDQVLSDLENDRIINWDVVTQSDRELNQYYEQALAKFLMLKESMSKLFVGTIRAAKKFDAKEICQKVKENKLKPEALQDLIPYCTFDGTKLSINTSLLKSEVNPITIPYLALNRKLTDRFREFCSEMDENLSSVEQLKKVPEKPQNKPINDQIQELDEQLKQLQIEYVPGTGIVTLETYQALVDASIQLTGTQFVALTQENRNQRRQYIQKENRYYLELCLNYISDVDKLLTEAFEKLCAQKGVDLSAIVGVEPELAVQYQQIQQQARQKIRNFLPTFNEISLDKTKDILRFQLTVLSEQQQFFIDLINILPNDPEVFYVFTVILNLALGDIIFQSLGYEEEQFSMNLQQEEKFDQEMIQIMEQLQQSLMSLIKRTHLGADL